KPADVRVRYLPSNTHFAVQPFECRGVHGTIREELERDRLPEFQVVRAVNLPHTSAAKERDDPIAVGEHRTGSKPRRIMTRSCIRRVHLGCAVRKSSLFRWQGIRIL